MQNIFLKHKPFGEREHKGCPHCVVPFSSKPGKPTYQNTTYHSPQNEGILMMTRTQSNTWSFRLKTHKALCYTQRKQYLITDELGCDRQARYAISVKINACILFIFLAFCFMVFLFTFLYLKWLFFCGNWIISWTTKYLLGI